MRTSGRSNPLRRPRPITVNSWEAVYFDDTLEPLDQLVERAAAIGPERFGPG
jgi:alpha-galactosidase